MKKEAIILIPLLFLIPVISSADCTPNWQCNDWSPCYNNLQIKKCVDLNLCGSDLNRPIERQACGPDCIPNWQCTSWAPEKCDKTLLQKRTCSDSNSCNTIQGKPEEAKSCIYKANYEWVFYIIVAIITILIIGTLWLIIKKSRNR